MNALLILVAATAATAYADQLRVTVYDHAHLPGQVVDDAFFQLRQVLRQAGINAQITPGDASSPEGFQVVYLGYVDPARFLEVICRARRDIALEILPAPPGVSARVLGMALPLAPGGLNVRVFADHVANTASNKSRTYVSLLAYVMAHEIGHVLLKTQGHTPHGIMANVWSRQEYDRIASQQLWFTGDQSRSMRAMLTGDRCALDGKLCRCRHTCGEGCNR